MDLFYHLSYLRPLKYNWILPEWVNENKKLIKWHLNHPSEIERYTEYHDIGKPFCLEIDEEGKQHFPNHELVSEFIYRQFFKKDTAVRRMIKNDMIMHKKGLDIKDFCTNNKEAMTLLIVSLAEIHANAEMFGGMDSVGFKIKYKRINSRGKQIISYFKEKDKDKLHYY